jgi:transposase
MSLSRSNDEPAGLFAHWGVERWRAEAERLAKENAALRARVGELEGQVGARMEKVATLSRLAFGKSSERKPKLAGSEPSRGAGDRRRQRRGAVPWSTARIARARPAGLLASADHGGGPRRPEAERVCWRCGARYAPFGQERCEQIHWEVHVSRIVHRYPTYRRGCRCPERGVLVAPPVPKPIPKGRFTAGFLARLVVEKFVLGRPAHRIVAALAFEGCQVAEGTLAGVLAAVCALLAPLAAAITERGSAAEHFGIDLDADTLPDGRRLLISSDFFTVTRRWPASMGSTRCTAGRTSSGTSSGPGTPTTSSPAGQPHAWRASAPSTSRTAPTEPGSAQASRAHAQITDALAMIDTARHTEAAEAATPALAREVLATLDHEWDGLAGHREYPELPLDDNTAERGLRPPVVGRKNYHGSGSVASAELAGRAWTITATAARAGLNPLRYLTGYLDACPAGGGNPPPVRHWPGSTHGQPPTRT